MLRLLQLSRKRNLPLGLAGVSSSESPKVIDIFGNDTMTLVPVNVG